MTAEGRPPVISVMLAVPDAGAAARWYTRALGATELWNLGSVIGLAVAGAPFFLGEPENNGWDTPAALGSRTVRGRGVRRRPGRLHGCLLGDPPGRPGIARHAAGDDELSPGDCAVARVSQAQA